MMIGRLVPNGMSASEDALGRIVRVALCCAGMVAALAAGAAGYTPVEWIGGTGAQWLNTRYTPASTDRIEMKVRFGDVSYTQALFCSRGTNTENNTFTAFLYGGNIRFDHGQRAGSSTASGPAKGTVYTVVADGSALTGFFSNETAVVSSVALDGTSFTGGSPLALFASHTAGTALSETSTMGNFGSYTLYSVRILDKAGSLIRDFVPAIDKTALGGRKGAGLYDRVTKTFLANSGSGEFAYGAETGGAELPEDESNWYVISVSPDEVDRYITEAEVAAAAGKTLVKKGTGTLCSNARMANFAGDIRIREGFFATMERGALGTSAGETYVEGGTLVNHAGKDSTTDGKMPTFKDEHIHLKGTGCWGWGALQDKVQCVDFCRTVSLEGDTRIVVSGVRFDFRFTAINMNGYRLETRGGSFLIVGPTIRYMGDITNETGYLEFQSSMNGVSESAQVTIRKGAFFGFWDSKTWIPCPFTFEADTRLDCTSGKFKFFGTDNRSIFSGPVTLQGWLSNNLEKDTQCQFRGKVTGAGGIRYGKGGYLQFASPKNDFEGGLDITGVVENGAPVGGVVAYANGAIPNGENAAPLKLGNANLHLREEVAYALPDLEMAGRTIVSNQYVGKKAVTAKTLKKTGSEELTVYGPLAVQGDTDLAAGTLRFGSQVANVWPGLKWTYQGVDKGVDASGVSYAYKGWPNITNQTYSYTGYIRVPGEEGADVTCNWMSSIARKCTVTIGGVLCASFNDNKNVKDGITVGWDRLAMYKPVTLKAGWQTIKVNMENWYDGTRGPQPNTKHGWVANFAIGVDWQARCVTNSANYAKLLDPGDGSFLRVALGDVKVSGVDQSLYRPTFGGNVAFGPGAVLDLNDYAPYTVLTIPSLSGVPTITNGAVNVTSSTWTLRPGDIAAGVPLAVAENASLTFAGGKSVTIDGDPEAIGALRRLNGGKRIFAGAAGYAFTLSERLKAAGCHIDVKDGDLVFSRPRGCAVIVK